MLGAFGSVGQALLQLGRRAGLTLVGTASPRHRWVLEQYGATFSDRHRDVKAAARAISPAEFDAVFDGVGGTSTRHCLARATQTKFHFV